MSKRTFSALSATLFTSLQSWARRRHPKKHRRWVNRKYWQALGNAQWVFAARTQQDAWMQLANHSDTPIRRFTKVQGTC